MRSCPSPPTITANEIDTAKTDVACKQKAHLITAWRRYESSYQIRRITQRDAEFRTIKADHDATMRRVTQVLTT
jgi:hypothetical protein